MASLIVQDLDFAHGMAAGREVYAEEVSGRGLTDTDLTTWMKHLFSRCAIMHDIVLAHYFGEQPTPDAFKVGFVVGYLQEALTEPAAQDVHISCPPDLVETLVAEFEHQFANHPDAEVYDYGWSSRFQQGYVVLEWKGYVPAEFTQRLNADPRLEGHSVSNAPELFFEPLKIAPRCHQVEVS